MNKKDRLLRKARQTKKTDDWNKYKQARNTCNNALRTAKQKFHQDLLTKSKNTPKAFWKSIKSLFPSKNDNAKIPAEPEIKGVHDVTEQSNAETFCLFFSNVAKNLKCISNPLRNFTWRTPAMSKKITTKRFKFKYVSKLYVEKQLRTMKRNKATGVDDISTNLLKDSASVISKPITHIVNLSLSTGVVPDEWKVARITPIHKSGTRSKADNYRPISILPAISKVLEKAVQTQLMDYLEVNKLLSDTQFGYRRKRSTELATTLFTDRIRAGVDKGCLTGAVFIDLSKAFDTIGHSSLIQRLRDYGVRENELEWFTNYLFSRFQYVSYSNENSKKYPILSGVPQGSILGPIMFLVFFDDFDQILKNSSVIKFADDTVIYVSDKNLESIERKLNEDLVRIHEYFKENELIINLKNQKQRLCFLVPVED